MLLSVALVFSSLVVNALCSNYTLPSGFNIGLVPLSTRQHWCTGERNSCPKICGGVATSNQCDPETLSFTCICSDGSAANVEPYLETIPSYVCQENFGQCIANHPDDLDGQNQCKEYQKKCGTITPGDDSSAVTTTAAGTTTTTAAATSTTTATTMATSALQSTAAASAASPSATTSKNAASAMRVAGDSSAVLLMTALFAAFRLML